MKENLFNAMVFNALWLTIVAIQPPPYEFIAILAAFYWRRQKSQYGFILLITCYGVVQDTILTHLGAWQFTMPSRMPIWLGLLWWIFAIWLTTQTPWIKKQPALIVLLLIGSLAPLSYFAAAELGAIQLLWPSWRTYATLVPIWMLFTAFFLGLVRHIPRH